MKAATGRRPTSRWWDDPRVVAAAQRYVRRGVRSAHEVVAYLRDHGLAAAAAARLVATFRQQGWVNDRACARLWADHWARQGYAWAAIRARLQTKGLDEPVIGQADAALGLSAGDGVRARQVAAGHRTRRVPASRVARRLAARGFDSELIERILTTSLAGNDSDAE